VRFLIDACLPREFAELLVSYSHVSIDLRDIGMRRAEDPDVAAHARGNSLCLLTEDWGFADIREYPPANYSGIVVIEVPDSSVDQKLAALRNLLSRPDIVQILPGRLAIVTPTKIRLRPPPTTG
jgi:predicted nuclease of predicted toxin-antitoxin system